MKQAYLWLMAVCAMLAMLVSNGLVLTGLSVFDVPLLKEFGFSLGALKFRDLITLALTGVVAPLIGILIDRVGVRAPLIAGSILLSLAISPTAGSLDCGRSMRFTWPSPWYRWPRGSTWQ